ncbi:ankyrin repeat-containing protein ITN1-like isoform X1 [Corylus avellana]|uniref:ankyrin repeat-containing protein ITN1-like isoform X1 n=1 Tax=Corylus avellana TaxID=13451 RepID=UPI00286C6EC2|nr:ankyrin repeat-containing protein ITN1-like isoform X1 [Corylus avellana]
MDRMHVEEENMVALYQASLNGCVSTLNTLIQTDPLLLNKVSLTSFSETPLHIAALLGHLEFTRVLVSKKSKLAEEVDSSGRTPLHLASAEGHTEIVKALLQANTSVCFSFDQDEKIPLHFAAMKGRIEIIKELIIAQPESIRVNLNGDSVLHLCVRYNHLDALKLLVESADCDEFRNSKDHDGNSTLHLAVMLKQIKAIKYLLSLAEIKRDANAMNKIGYTALDVVEICPRDFKCFEIQSILKEAGVKRSIDLNSSLPLTPSRIVTIDEARLALSRQPTRSSFRRCWGYVCSSLVKHLKYQENWIEETRGTLMVVATVIASMAFQAGISPPGGVWQQNTSNSTGSNCGEDDICQAGKAVLSYSSSNLNEYRYRSFISCNTISFIASVCVLFLVISGFPLTTNFFIWFLTLSMSISVASMTFAYLFAVALVTPVEVFSVYGSLVDILAEIWFGVIVIVIVTHIIRPLSWMVKKLRNFRRKSITGQA